MDGCDRHGIEDEEGKLASAGIVCREEWEYDIFRCES